VTDVVSDTPVNQRCSLRQSEIQSSTVTCSAADLERLHCRSVILLPLQSNACTWRPSEWDVVLDIDLHCCLFYDINRSSTAFSDRMISE
jgi:hypothetical protein